MATGKLYVISGPSGVGKGTVVSRITEDVDSIWTSVSATTRRPREGEVDGVNYFFLSTGQFEELIDHNGFLEWAKYGDNYYGTPLASVEEHLANGDDVILEIEVQGAEQVRQKINDAKLIFIAPPSLDELRRRLVDRKTEDADVITKRMMAAEVELSKQDEYDIVFVNDSLDDCVSALSEYISKNRSEE